MKPTAALTRWLRDSLPRTFSRAVERASEEPRLEFVKREPQLGLCLGSGGARGLAHIGVIQVLEEHHIPIAAITGSSMGAYVGALWAAGCDGAKLQELAREIKDRRTLLSLLDPIFPPSEGLIRGEKLRQHLERSLGTMTFAELRKPLLVIATDLDTRAPHLFDQGPVAAAVHASAAIPGICAPVMLDGRRYTDGGTCQPLPVSLLRRRFAVDHVLAVNLTPLAMDYQHSRAQRAVRSTSPLSWLWHKLNLMAEGNVIDTFQRALMSAQMHIAATESALADVVLHPEFEAGRWHDFENHERYIAAGRRAAEAALPRLLALLRTDPFEPHTRLMPEASPMPSATETQATIQGGGYYETATSRPSLGLNRA